MFGAVAQLGERRVRNAEVRGSIPLCSTIYFQSVTDVFARLLHNERDAFVTQYSSNATAARTFSGAKWAYRSVMRTVV